MGFSLSQGPWTYNRFDLAEGKHAKPDYLDFDKDGDKKEPMKKALKEKGKKQVNEGEMPDFIKKKMDEKKGKKSGDCSCDDKEKKEEFLSIAQELVSEGHDLSDYTWDELYTIYESNLETAPIEMAEAEDVLQRMSDSGIFSEAEINAIREGWKPLPREKMDRQAGKAYGKEQQAVAKGDAAGANKQMQRRNAMQMPQGRKSQLTRKNSPINKLSERG